MQRVVTVLQIPGNTAGLSDIGQKDRALTVSAEQVSQARAAFEEGPRVLASAKQVPDGDYVQVDERTYPFAVGSKRATALAALAIEESPEFLSLDSLVKLLLSKAQSGDVVSFDDIRDFPALQGLRLVPWRDRSVQDAVQRQLAALTEEGEFDVDYLLFRRGADIFPYTFVREGTSTRMVGPSDHWVQLSSGVELRPGALPQSIAPVLRSVGPHPPVGYLVIGFWKEARTTTGGNLQLWATFAGVSREFENDSAPNIRLPFSMPERPPQVVHIGVPKDGYIKRVFRHAVSGSGVTRTEAVEVYYPDHFFGDLAQMVLPYLFPYIRRYIYLPGGGPSAEEQQALLDQLDDAKNQQASVRDVTPGEDFEEEVEAPPPSSGALPLAAAAGLVGYLLLRGGD